MDKSSDYSLGYLITKVGRIATKMYAERLAAIDLTPLQAGILMSVEASAGLSQKQLMALLHVDKGTIHQMLKGLVAKKLILIEPSDGDKRFLNIQITKLGRDLLPAISKIDAAVSDELLSKVSAKHRQSLSLALLETFEAYES